jgi:PAS domain S-box-containing protein
MRLAGTSPGAHSGDPKHANAKATGARTVLVADDREDRREAISFWLRQVGFEVLTASNAAELLECVEHRPDVIVLDSDLPGPRGFELANQLKGDPATAGIPIIHVVPGFTTGEWRAPGLDAGADSFLTRPVESQELIATVRALLRVRAAEENVRIAADQWEATFDAITDAVCIINARGELDRCNDAADVLLGQLNHQRVAREFHELFPPPGEAARETIANVIASAEPLQYEVHHDDRWFAVRLDPVPPREQVAPAVVAVISDITERRRAEHERARLLANTERARKEAEISRLEAEAARPEKAFVSEWKRSSRR